MLWAKILAVQGLIFVGLALLPVVSSVALALLGGLLIAAGFSSFERAGFIRLIDERESDGGLEHRVGEPESFTPDSR